MKRIARKSCWVIFPVFICILALGFYLRMRSATGTVVINALRADAGNYFMYAYNLRYKHTYSRDTRNIKDLNSPVVPDSQRSPGYPLFLTVFLDGLSFDSFVHKVVVTQAILSSLTIILAFLLFKSFLPAPWAVAATFLVAISPQLIILSGFVVTETLFCFLLVSVGYVSSLLPQRPSVPLAALIGILVGLASLVRPILEYLPFIFGFLLLTHFGWKKGLPYSAALLFGFLLSFSPWILRNVLTLGKISDDTLLINFLHHGMYPNFTFEGLPESVGYPYRFDPRSAEIGRNIPSVLNAIWERFQERPWEHLKWFLIGKPVAFWSWDDVTGMGGAFIYPVVSSPYFREGPFQWTHFLMFIIHWPLVVLGGIASLLVWSPTLDNIQSQKSVFTIRFIALVLISYTLVHMIGAPIQRYSFPLRPYLYGMAIFLAFFLWETLSAKLLSYKIDRQKNGAFRRPAFFSEEIND